MNDDDQHKNQFSAELNLPQDPKTTTPADDQTDSNPAADLIRKKIDAAYAHEPPAQEEVQEASETAKQSRSKHQEFIYSLTNSGRPLHEIQTAWHEYYAGLADDEKHKVWQEFYSAHSQAAQHPVITHKAAELETHKPIHKRPTAQSIRQAASKAAKKTERRPSPKPDSRKPASPLHSILFGLGIGSITILIFLFSFFNERIIAPFIQPSRTSTNIPIISGAVVSQAPEVIIPKINVEIPVVYDVNTISDDAIQVGLQRGAVHYADTAVPGQNGNIVIVGHSSGNIFNQGNYKFAFSLLRAMDSGDTFFLQKDGQRYTYQIYEKKVVKPTDVSVLALTNKPATATLITCDPPGTSASRLVLVAEQISPDPSANSQVALQPQIAAATIIPSDSPTLWSRLTHWFSN